jgi:hypothetical protein
MPCFEKNISANRGAVWLLFIWGAARPHSHERPARTLNDFNGLAEATVVAIPTPSHTSPPPASLATLTRQHHGRRPVTAPHRRPPLRHRPACWALPSRTHRTPRPAVSCWHGGSRAPAVLRAHAVLASRGWPMIDDACDAANTALEPECRGSVLLVAVQFRVSGLALP